MADYELKEGRKRTTPVAATREERVAIIGSGPAGLSCAYDLVRMGYPVTVFETAPKSGGMLRYCIPEYRLPKAILDNEIGYIEELGVEIRTSVPQKSLAEIFREGYQGHLRRHRCVDQSEARRSRRGGRRGSLCPRFSEKG